jgi:serine/threonine protein kinase
LQARSTDDFSQHFFDTQVPGSAPCGPFIQYSKLDEPISRSETCVVIGATLHHSLLDSNLFAPQTKILKLFPCSGEFAKDAMLELSYEQHQLSLLSKCPFVVNCEHPGFELSYKDQPYKALLLERCDTDLDHFVKTYSAVSPAAQKADFRSLALQILQAYRFCHSLEPSIAQRDVKAKNVLVNRNPLGIKLCDFATGRLFRKHDKTKKAIISENWSSPEMLNGQEYDLTHDLWGIGA